MLSCSVSSGAPGRPLDAEYESKTILRNVGSYLSVDTTQDVTSQTARLFSSMAARTLDISGIPAFDVEELLTFRRKVPSCDGNSVDTRRGETVKTKVIHFAVARENFVRQLFCIFSMLPPPRLKITQLSCTAKPCLLAGNKQSYTDCR